jgi:hypothetical protein
VGRHDPDSRPLEAGLDTALNTAALRVVRVVRQRTSTVTPPR